MVSENARILSGNGEQCYKTKSCVLHPRPLTWQKEFLMFYMCQLRALHVFTKRQFFYLY